MQGKSPLLAVCGTRPEAVKLSPVVGALRGRGHRVVVVATGQHRDLAPRMFAELGLAPDIALQAMPAGGGPGQMLGSFVGRLGPVIAAFAPALILVQGDTVSTLAGALAGACARVPVAHIEAGLRTPDITDPFPEEMHRRLVAPVASLHFAPTRRAARALRGEAVPASRIHVTGNSGIDALFATCARLDADRALQQSLARRFRACIAPGVRLVLATIHRRENHGARLGAISVALARLAAEESVCIVLPLHPNPAVRGPLVVALDGVPGVRLVEPLDHAAMVWLMRHAQLLMTDSGGLQEEAPSLGLRTLVLRATTERPEAVEAGAAELSPPEPDAIHAAALRLLALPPLAPLHPFGDGRAGARIAAIIENWLG